MNYDWQLGVKKEVMFGAKPIQVIHRGVKIDEIVTIGHLGDQKYEAQVNEADSVWQSIQNTFGSFI